jgi:lysophospholipase L1-like esterase
LPQRNHLESNFSKNSYLQVKKIVSDLDIPFIDIKEEVFEKYEDINELFPFLFKSRVHFNSKGYKKVAETIYNFDQK